MIHGLLGSTSVQVAPWQVIVSISAVVGAFTVLWRGIIRPAMKATVWMESVLPVLNAIATEFRADSGSSLRDEVDGMHNLVVGNAQQMARLTEMVTRIATAVGRIDNRDKEELL